MDNVGLYSSKEMSTISCSLLLGIWIFEFLLDGTSSETSSSGGNKTDLLSWWGKSGDSCWVTNVLMVTTTVWMLDWVHSNTTNDWPVTSLDSVLVELDGSLQVWLFATTATCSDADHSTGVAVDGLSGTGGEDDTCLGTIVGVADDGCAATACSCELAGVASTLLDVHDDGTFWDQVDGEDVADCDGCLGAAVDVLACVHAL